MLPIHFACKGGNSTGMLYLINSGSSVDAVDNVNKPLYFPIFIILAHVIISLLHIGWEYASPYGLQG